VLFLHDVRVRPTEKAAQREHIHPQTSETDRHQPSGSGHLGLSRRHVAQCLRVDLFEQVSRETFRRMHLEAPAMWKHFPVRDTDITKRLATVVKLAGATASKSLNAHSVRPRRHRRQLLRRKCNCIRSSSSWREGHGTYDSHGDMPSAAHTITNAKVTQGAASAAAD